MILIILYFLIVNTHLFYLLKIRLYIVKSNDLITLKKKCICILNQSYTASS